MGTNLMDNKDAARWRFLANSPQMALMLGTDKDPNDLTVNWVEECNRLIDKIMKDKGGE